MSQIKKIIIIRCRLCYKSADSNDKASYRDSRGMEEKIHIITNYETGTHET